MKKLIEKNKELILYLFAGVCTTVVSMGIFYFCIHTFLDDSNAVQLQIANILSWIGSVSFAYIINRILVFKSKNKQILKELFTFFSSRILTLLLDMGIMFIFVTWLTFNCDIMKIVSTVLVMIGNYFISKLIVFKEGK